MRPGNVSQTVWRRSVLKQLHTEESVSLLKLSEAENCAAIPIPAEEGVVVLTADGVSCGNAPVIGYIAVAKAVNELMARGGEPLSIRARISLPVSAEEADVQALVREMQTLCGEEQLSLDGIRVETVPALLQTMVQVTVTGQAKKSELRHLDQAAPGQEIILCGSLALEGMQQILEECMEDLGNRFVPSFLRQMKTLKGELIQADTIRAVRNSVTAMQQVGSGGILAALWETAEAARIGLQVEMPRMTICQETIEVCEYYQLNPYQMTSTGAVLMFTSEGEKVLEILQRCGARAVRLGSTTAGNARVITSGKEMRFLDRPAPDELALWQEKRMSE